MIKLFFGIVCLLMCMVASTYSQSLVSTIPHKRTVVLEEFTGLNCGYCPDGHRIASGLKVKYNDEPILINLHVGSFADPSTNQPDYRTSFGDSIDKQAAVTGYPSGTVNRLVFPNIGPNLSLSRGEWELAIADLLQMSSPANVGVKSTFDNSNRQLTVEVEIYYTSDAPQPVNTVNVVLTENDVIGYQSDYTNGSQQKYHHMHMLRYMLAGQWGEEFIGTGKGTLVKKTYKYNVPDEYNISNCEVAAFVSNGQKDIYSGAEVKADGGTTMITSSISSDAPTVFATDKLEPMEYVATVTNMLDNTEQFSIDVVPSTPNGWTNSVMVDGVLYSGGNFTIGTSATKKVTVSINPTAISGVGSVDVFVHSKTYPKSPTVKRTFYLMSGVSNLLMSHPDGVKYDSVYIEAMNSSGLTASGKMNRNVFEKFAEANAFTGIKNLYYNVSWAFPGLTDITMDALKSLMDKGVNVMIAGQDFAWDIASGDVNAKGSAITKEFLTSYMMTKFIADGTSSNSLLTAVKTDPIFKIVTNSAITNPYGGTNLYPEQVEPLDGASTIFSYNNSTRFAGVRAQRSNYKVVFLGIGLEQISLESRNQILNRTAKWFSGEISNVEFDDLYSGGVKIFPIPASSNFTVALPQEMKKGIVSLYNITGNLMKSIPFTEQSTLSVNVEDVPVGAYRLYIENTSGGKIATGMISVVR